MKFFAFVNGDGEISGLVCQVCARKLVSDGIEVVQLDKPDPAGRCQLCEAEVRS